MRIGVDIDGVLFPWTDVVNEALADEFGLELGDHNHWDWLKAQLTREQWAWVWSREGQSIVFGQVERVYPGVVDMVNDMTRSGHEVHFVTHRDPRRTALQTAAFLTLHFGAHPWAGVHVLQNGCRKCDLMAAEGWDVFIDDKPSTVDEMVANTNAMVFMPARPWNRRDSNGTTWGRWPWLMRYDDPAEVTEWLASRG